MASSTSEKANERHCLLFRHAETSANVENRFVSATDLSLNARGRRQIQILRPRFKDLAFDRVICSPARRCKDTAKLLLGSSTSQTCIMTDSRLLEVRAGALEGLRRGDAESSPLADLLIAWEAEHNQWISENAERWGGTASTPEPLIDAQRRIRKVWDELVSDSGIRSSLIISHGTVLRLLICALLGVPRSQYRSLRIDTCGYFDIVYRKGSADARLVALVPGPKLLLAALQLVDLAPTNEHAFHVGDNPHRLDGLLE